MHTKMVVVKHLLPLIYKVFLVVIETALVQTINKLETRPDIVIPQLFQPF